jgi:hypothetical protein
MGETCFEGIVEVSLRQRSQPAKSETKPTARRSVPTSKRRELWDEGWLRERLQRMAQQGYENQISAVVEVGTEQINDYILMRRREGAANGTINRELAALYGVCLNLVSNPTLRPWNVFRASTCWRRHPPRSGFVEYPDFLRLRFAAESEPVWLRVLLELAFASLRLLLAQERANPAAGTAFQNATIRLNPGTTKNGKGREVAMTARIANYYARPRPAQRRRRKCSRDRAGTRWGLPALLAGFNRPSGVTRPARPRLAALGGESLAPGGRVGVGHYGNRRVGDGQHVSPVRHC